MTIDAKIVRIISRITPGQVSIISPSAVEASTKDGSKLLVVDSDKGVKVQRRFPLITWKIGAKALRWWSTTKLPLLWLHYYFWADKIEYIPWHIMTRNIYIYNIYILYYIYRYIYILYIYIDIYIIYILWIIPQRQPLGPVARVRPVARGNLLLWLCSAIWGWQMNHVSIHSQVISPQCSTEPDMRSKAQNRKRPQNLWSASA